MDGVADSTFQTIMSAISISARTCTPTLSCPEEPPCSQESASACPRKLPHLPPHRSRSRLWLLQSASTPCGSEDPFWPRFPHSKACGSPKRNTMNLVHRLFTASASKEKQKYRKENIVSNAGFEKRMNMALLEPFLGILPYQ